MLRRWRKESGLWRIPLEDEVTKDNVQNPNTQTIMTSKAPIELLHRKNKMISCAIYTS